MNICIQEYGESRSFPGSESGIFRLVAGGPMQAFLLAWVQRQTRVLRALPLSRVVRNRVGLCFCP